MLDCATILPELPMTTATYRVEHDSLGALDVPTTAPWGAETQRAIQNFPPSGLSMPRAFVRAFGFTAHDAARAESGERGGCNIPGSSV